MLILKNYEAQFVLSAEDSLEKGTQTVVIEHLTITTILEYTKHEKITDVWTASFQNRRETSINDATQLEMRKQTKH